MERKVNQTELKKLIDTYKNLPGEKRTLLLYGSSLLLASQQGEKSKKVS